MALHWGVAVGRGQGENALRAVEAVEFTWCGDGKCEARVENVGWCPSDCSCGDNVCDNAELSSSSCPSDCFSYTRFSTQPGNASGANPVFPQPVVDVIDAGGVLAYTTAAVSATLVSYPGGTALPPEMLFGSASIASSCGVSSYTDLSIRAAGIYSLSTVFTVGTGTLIRSFTAESRPFYIQGGSIHHLRLSVQPAGFRPSYAFKNQPVVSLEDYGGNRILSGPDSTIAVTASMAPGNPSEVALVPPNRLVKSAVFGIAKFNDLYLPPSSLGKYISLLFSAPFAASIPYKSVLLPSKSSAFLVGDVASRLTILATPASAVTIQMFDPMPSIEVQDVDGNRCTWYEDDGVVISVDLISPGGVIATLLGEKSLRAENGRVTFTDLNVDKNGVGFQLVFRISAGAATLGISTSSPRFNVSFGVPTKVVIASGTNPTGASPGNLLLQQPTIAVQDGVGNVVGDAVVSITATLLQHGVPAAAPFRGSTVRTSCRQNQEGACQCGTLPCGEAVWPETDGSGLRVDTVGTNYSFRFTSPGVAPAISFPPFDVRFGAVAKLDVVQEPCGFALGKPFVCPAVVRVLDQVGNFVPTTGARVVAELLVGGICCFEPKISMDTVNGYATFPDVTVTSVPTYYVNNFGQEVPLGSNLRLRFFNPDSEYAESREFYMAQVGVRLNITQQPGLSVPGFGLNLPPAIELRDRFDVRSGWYSDFSPYLRLTICKEIPCVMGSFVGGVRTGNPCFKCSTDTSSLCDIQDQTPVLVRPRTIPTEAQMVTGNLEVEAYDGIWRFTDLRVDTIGTYFFRFKSPQGFPPIDSAPFTVFPGVSAQLFLLTEPTTAPPTAPLSQQPVVAVRDAGGNVVTSDSTTLLTASLTTISLAGSEEGTAPAVLRSANTYTMGLQTRLSFGVAYFQRLNVHRAGLFAIRFDADSASITPTTSAQFRIQAGPAAIFFLRTMPSECFLGAACVGQPRLDVLDAGGNLARTFPKVAALKVKSADPSCAWVSASTFSAAVNGAKAVFSGFGVGNEAGASAVPSWCGGRFVVNASVPGLGAFISKEFLASQPVALVVSFVPLAPTQPASTLRVFPVAALEDPSERLVTVASSLVTATLLQCAPADLLNCSAVTVVPLIGTKSKQTVDGKATFTNLRIDRAGKCYRFKFDAPGLLGGLSTLFDVQIGSFLSLLEVVQQPVGATAGGSFNLQPQLVALDGGLNVMTTLSSLAVSASLLVGASKVDFHTSSRRSQTFDAGLATYTDLRVDGAGCCNRITFEANAKTTVSNVFCVKPGAPSHLALARPPSEPAVGWHFGVQPVVHLEDAYGNKVDGTNCVYSCERLTANISATISEVEQDATANLPFDPVGTLLGNRRARVVSGASSVAFFTDLRVDRAGGYVLIFAHASPSLVSAVTSDLLRVFAADDRAVQLGVVLQPNGIRSARVFGTGDAAVTMAYPFSIQPRVAVQDLGGNTLISARANITATLENIGLEFDDNIILFGGKTVAVINGIAAFTNLDLRYQPSKRLRLIFTSDAMCTSSSDYCTATASAIFDIGGAVQRMEFLAPPPATAIAGEPFTQDPLVAIYDATGRRYTWFSAANHPDNITVAASQTMAASECASGFLWLYEQRLCVNATNYTSYTEPNFLRTAEPGAEMALYVEGEATFPGLRFDTVAQSPEGYRIDFLHIATTGEDFHLTYCCVLVSPAAPASLSVLLQPNGTRPGLPMTEPPAVETLDRFGNRVTYSSAPVSAVLQLRGIHVSPALYPSVGRLVVDSSSGLANFTGLGFNRIGEGFSLRFSSPGLPDVESTNFTLVAGLEVVSIAVAVQPDRTSQGLVFGVSPVVTARDLGNNTAPVPGSIRAELFYGNGSNSSAKLGPASALTSSSEDGVYNFPVYVTLPTANVSILFTLLNASGFSLGITARTDFFEVATNATSLVFVRKPPAILVASVPFATVVHVEDRWGLRVSQHSTSLVLSAALETYGRATVSCPSEEPYQCGESLRAVCAKTQAACPTLRGTTTVAVSRGIASFSDLSLTRCNAQPANASLPRNDACSQAKYRIVFKATVASLPFTVASDDVSVIIGPATALTVLTSASSVAAGKPFSPLPEIVVVDAGGNRVTSFVSQVSATLIPTELTACCFECECPTKIGAFTATSVAGRARFSTLAINTVGTGYGLTFASASLTPVTITFTVLVGPASDLRVRRQPVGGRSSASKIFSSQPEIEILDAGRNVVVAHVGSVTAALLPNEFGATLGGPSAVAVVLGIAQFRNLLVKKEGSCFILRFTHVWITAEVSEPFTVEIGAADRMAVMVQPKNPRPGYPFEIQPAIAVLDAGDNIDPAFSGAIAVAVENSVGTVVPLCSFNTPGTLGAPGCMSQAQAINGLSTFAGLRVDTAGVNFRLKFTFGFLTAVSDPFDVVANDPYILNIDQQPVASTSANTDAPRGNPGFLLYSQAIISILDYGGNTLQAGVSAVAAELFLLNRKTSHYPEEVYEQKVQIYDQSLTLPSLVERIYTRPFQANGIARYTNLRIDRWAAEGYAVRFSAPGVLFAESVPFAVQIGVPYSVGVRRAPAGIQAGIAFRVQPVVHVQDRGKNTQVWLSPAYSMIASIVDGPTDGMITPIASLFVPIVSGVAVFTSLSMSLPGLYVMKFKAWTLENSAHVQCNASAPKQHLAMWRKPAGDVAAVVLMVQPHVALRDLYNVTVDIDSTTLVTASILRSSDPHVTAASLSGTRTVQCCWGLCKFTDLVIAKSGQRYVLQFDSPGVKTTFTQPFEVFGPSTLNVLRQPSGAVSDSDIPIQPRVRVTDTLGELMVRCQRDACQIGGAAEVTASIKVGTGGLTLHSIAGTLVEPVVDGVANFTNLVIFGAGASFSERDYILLFRAVDLYEVESSPFKLLYVPRPPTGYVLAAVELTPFSVVSFDATQQLIFVKAMSAITGMPEVEVEIVSVVATEKVDLRRQPTSLDVSRRQPTPLDGKSTKGSNSFGEFDSSARRFAGTGVGGAPSGSRDHDEELRTRAAVGHEDEGGHAEIGHEAGSGHESGRRAVFEDRIDVTFKVFSNSSQALVDIQDALTAVLSREGALGEEFVKLGLYGISTRMILAPEAFSADGAKVYPMEVVDAAASIVGGVVGGVLAIALLSACYVAHARAKRREMIKVGTENEEDVLFAIGVEDNHEMAVDASMPWTAERILEDEKKVKDVFRDDGDDNT